ncbi:MAG: dehydrogenase E1 component subunit alpha/beta [Cytophagaceae bacterium]|jgi:2-oxoisovalerate dehydrogenase E1 component|nr:dehydrogenase E1 component subunit alpha/beta [Cytophagaceae bacterium]
MIAFDRKQLEDSTLLSIYQELLKPRLIEEKMLLLLRQGELSKWFSGIGQEAISVGVGCALHPEDYLLPLHRNLGVFTSRGVPLHRLFCQFQGKPSGFTKGRDRSFHFGTKEHHIVGMISHLGPQMAVADGIALAEKLSRSGRTTLVFTGDGGTSEGDFHEALNIAAVWNLPVLFLVENNGYGLSTPVEEQFVIKSFKEKGPAYGIDTISIDGNNVLEVYHTIQAAAKKVQEEQKPILIEANTFRMRGHEEASGTTYVPDELFAYWASKDPVENYEHFLLQEGILQPGAIESIKQSIQQTIQEAWAYAQQESLPVADSSVEQADMYVPYVQAVVRPRTQLTRPMRMVDAIQDALRLGLERHRNLILMGQDIAEYGGVFKVTEGLLERFGKDRIRNTPLCESAVIGAGLGLAIKQYKSVIEIQFADFVTNGFNQIVNNLAKSYYRWEQNADVVIRLPTGAGLTAGPFHSQSTEAWFFHTPGLKIVYPSNAVDAKGLLLAAIEDPNPVLFYEHKALYRNAPIVVSEDYYTTLIGEAVLIEQGSDISIITYGMGVLWAKEVCQQLQVSADIVDLRTLLPWDKETILRSVKKTGRALVLHEDTLTGGISAEIASYIQEAAFEYLDAPVKRLGALDTAVPFAKTLEDNFLPKSKLVDMVHEILSY